jgi:hypothetical protein
VTTPTTASGGGICPLCRWAQDHGHPHPCITNPNVAAIAKALPLFTGWSSLCSDLFKALTDHPARPLTASLGGKLRPVDRTWCTCQCSPTPSTAPPGAARS